MKTYLDPKTGILTVTLKGDLVSTAADQVRGQMTALLETPTSPDATWKLFRLDLVTAKMVDSVGLNFIITILKAVQKNGAKMQILYTNQNVHRTFLFTRLDQHIELVKI
jgi:anti-anti-sigma factor